MTIIFFLLFNDITLSLHFKWSAVLETSLPVCSMTVNKFDRWLQLLSLLVFYCHRVAKILSDIAKTPSI